MRAPLLVLALVLTACGGDADTPIVADGTDVTILTPAADAPLADADDNAGDMPAGADATPADAAPADAVAPDEIGPSPDTEAVSVAMWAGDAPVMADGTRFVAVPPVRAKLDEAFGVEPGLMDKLLAEPSLYTAAPIEAVGGMLGVTFEPTAANPDDRTLHLLVADDASHAFAVLTDPDGDTFYRASYDASGDVLPAQAAAWMGRAANVDFLEMVRQSDAEVLGP